MRIAFVFFLTLFAFLQGGPNTAHGAAQASSAHLRASDFSRNAGWITSTPSRPDAPGSSFFNFELSDDDESNDSRLEPVVRSLQALLSAFLPEPRYYTLAAPACWGSAHSFLSTDRYIGLCTFRI